MYIPPYAGHFLGNESSRLAAIYHSSEIKTRFGYFGRIRCLRSLAAIRFGLGVKKPTFAPTVIQKFDQILSIH